MRCDTLKARNVAHECFVAGCQFFCRGAMFAFAGVNLLSRPQVRTAAWRKPALRTSQ